MRKRGWTDESMREALATTGISTQGKHGPALRYVHPETRMSVVVDVRTSEIFHIGGKEFEYE
jgi:hypothetical protein